MVNHIFMKSGILIPSVNGIELDDLTHFSIYDWKESYSYRHVTDGKNVEWHIGHDGKPGTLEKVKAWLHGKGVEVDKSMYYKTNNI